MFPAAWAAPEMRLHPGLRIRCREAMRRVGRSQKARLAAYSDPLVGNIHIVLPFWQEVNNEILQKDGDGSDSACIIFGMC